eukprot:3774018-Pleurochrysis_carterae.AAC.1
MREGGSKTARLMGVLLGNPDETLSDLDVQLYAEHHLNKMPDFDGGGDRVRSSKRHKPCTEAVTPLTLNATDRRGFHTFRRGDIMEYVWGKAGQKCPVDTQLIRPT